VWYLREHIFGNPHLFHWLIYNLTYYPYDWQHREVNGTNAQARQIFGSVIKTLLNDIAPRDVLELEKPSISARMGSMICTNLTRTLTEWQRSFGTNRVNNENGIRFGNLDIISSMIQERKIAATQQFLGMGFHEDFADFVVEHVVSKGEVGAGPSNEQEVITFIDNLPCWRELPLLSPPLLPLKRKHGM
jgi:hypothetical protein